MREMPTRSGECPGQVGIVVKAIEQENQVQLTEATPYGPPYDCGDPTADRMAEVFGQQYSPNGTMEYLLTDV